MASEGVSSFSDQIQRAPQAEKPNIPSKNRQRFKPQLSCIFCRNRKLKCDRNLPCDNCTKRNLSSSCNYVHVNKERPSNVSKSTSASNNSATRDVQSQISHLEELVVSLMNRTSKLGSTPSMSESGKSSYSPTENDSPLDNSTHGNTGGVGLQDTAESFGRICMDEEQPNYVGSAHWAAILDNIACLKDKLGTGEASSVEKESTPTSTGPELLVGSVRPATRTEILSSFPPRAVVDGLVDDFLAMADICNSVVHVPTFAAERERFWANPSCMSISWIGQLFSLLCLATIFEAFSNSSKKSSHLAGLALNDPTEAIELFRERTIQCLILSDYTVPGPYTIVTLLLYFIADHFRSPDTQFGAWMMFGLVVRAAFRLGYHRDPSHFSKISVFQGEMQRRIWAIVGHLDLTTSLQVGLPRMIREGMYDTQMPRVLLDSDFNEHTKVLPPSRIESSPTHMGYSNAKNLLYNVFGLIVDQANSTIPITYEEVMKLDNQLITVYQGSPQFLKVRSMQEFEDESSAIMLLRKFAIDLTFQKARCVLHRKFFLPGTSTTPAPYPYSTSSCIEASMRLLQSHVFIYKEGKPGMKLCDHTWRTSSLMTQDFLLAAMLLCLHLGHTLALGASRQSTNQTEISKWNRDEIVQILQQSHDIWDEASATSTEAKKAARALKSMITKVRSQESAGRSNATPVQYLEQPHTSWNSNSERSISDGHTPGSAVTEDSLSSWIQISPDIMNTQAQASNTMSPMFQQQTIASADVSMDSVNWDVWDNHFMSNNQYSETTPPDLWNVDPNLAYSDANVNPNFMAWDPQL